MDWYNRIQYREMRKAVSVTRSVNVKVFMYLGVFFLTRAEMTGVDINASGPRDAITSIWFLP